MNEGALAVYKSRPALVSSVSDGGKITIAFEGGAETLKVREKDVEVLHPGPLRDFAGLDADGAEARGDVQGAWELIRDGGEPVPLREFAELAFGSFTPASAWAAWRVLCEGIYFTGTAAALVPRSAAEKDAACEKRESKEREGRERGAFLERFRDGKLELPADSRFLQDVQALAYGGSEKSRTLKELGRSETPEEAHRLLLDCGAWSAWINPHPRRCGVSLHPAPSFPFAAPGTEGREDLTRLAAFAIDSPWSADPDDAVSVETVPDGHILYVHVADPACVVGPGSAPDIEARGRGATAYLPEICCRMLPGDLLPVFALGLGDVSPALTFKLFLDGGGAIVNTEIAPSLVKVTRLSYEEAQALAARGDETGSALRELFQLAEVNLERRLNAGAVNIELPETHIAVGGRGVAGPECPGPAEGGSGKAAGFEAGGEASPLITIEAIESFQSADMVRECMLLAGAGAALWAQKRRLAFPYITQETGELPSKPLPGMAGSWQLRRCMRPRSVSVTPGCHWGLGLDAYTQVTSPLRRYTDLLAHQQIRAFLAAEAGVPGAAPLEAGEVLARLASGDAAAQAVTQAERASRAYWLAVYLSGKKGSLWDGVVLEKRGNALGVMIPALALETQAPLQKSLEPNDPVTLRMVKADIVRPESRFELA